jgi:hypothetical protein
MIPFPDFDASVAMAGLSRTDENGDPNKEAATVRDVLDDTWASQAFVTMRHIVESNTRLAEKVGINAYIMR